MRTRIRGEPARATSFASKCIEGRFSPHLHSHDNINTRYDQDHDQEIGHFLLDELLKGGSVSTEFAGVSSGGLIHKLQLNGLPEACAMGNGQQLRVVLILRVGMNIAYGLENRV